MAVFHTQWGTTEEVFHRLRSIQFDPLAPVGSNHDLVLQSRVKKYKVGDWQKTAYRDRLIYDGWDKQACLISFDGWPARRIFHVWLERYAKRMLEEDAYAIEAVLQELKERGPLAPRDFQFQEHRPEWKSSWYGPNLTKRALRTLWNLGQVMTHSRRAGQHIYDLAERIVPPEYFNLPMATEEECVRELILDRHKAVGLLRPNAQQEVWSLHVPAATKRAAIEHLVVTSQLVPVDVEGVRAHAVPEFLQCLESVPPKRVTFVAPLDQLMWDRKMINHLFGFDYVWEVYKPEAERKWGYYVLPVLFEDSFAARIEAWSRKGVLEIRKWHWEVPPTKAFWKEYAKTMKRFMEYCSAEEVTLAEGVDERLKQLQ